MHVCHLFMDQWMSSEIANGPVVLCWPNSAGYSRRMQPNEPALPAVHLRGLSCQSRSSSEIHSHAVISVLI